MAFQPRPTASSHEHLERDPTAQRVAALFGREAVVGRGQVDGSTNELLTLNEAAARARLSTRTLRRALRAGRLRASQPSGRGGKLLIAVRDLEQWLFAESPVTVRARTTRSAHRLAEPPGIPARISIADLRRPTSR